MKHYTNLEQSRKLLELGLSDESCDMYIGNYVGKSRIVDGTNTHYFVRGESFGAPEIIPCWSVGALVELMPESIVDDINLSYGLCVSKNYV